MKLGVGLYRYMLKDEEFTFARQCGCSDVIIHLANYYDGENDIVKATDEKENYGIARAGESVWSLDHLSLIHICQECQNQEGGYGAHRDRAESEENRDCHRIPGNQPL